jgi:hypothetical protein
VEERGETCFSNGNKYLMILISGNLKFKKPNKWWILKGSHYITNAYFLRVGSLKITLSTLINSNLYYRTPVVNFFFEQSRHAKLDKILSPCSGDCRFFSSRLTFAIPESFTIECYIEDFPIHYENKALNYVLSVSVIKNVRFMKVILHSVNYPSWKKEK